MTGASFQTQTEFKTLEVDGQTLKRLHKALFLRMCALLFTQLGHLLSSLTWS